MGRRLVPGRLVELEADAEPPSPTPQRCGRVEVEVKVDAVIKQDAAARDGNHSAVDEDDSEYEVEDPRLAVQI